MPNPVETPQGVTVVPNQSNTETTQTMNLLLQKMVGDNTPNLTEIQVNELLLQRKHFAGLMHEDKKRESKDSRFYLVVVLLFILLFSGLVIWVKPDLFTQVLSLIAGLFGGGLGGYGLGIKTRN